MDRAGGRQAGHCRSGRRTTRQAPKGGGVLSNRRGDRSTGRSSFRFEDGEREQPLAELPRHVPRQPVACDQVWSRDPQHVTAGVRFLRCHLCARATKDVEGPAGDSPLKHAWQRGFRGAAKPSAMPSWSTGTGRAARHGTFVRRSGAPETPLHGPHGPRDDAGMRT